MSDVPMGFEPHYDWSKISPEQAHEMAQAISDFRQTQKRFLFERTPELAASVILTRHIVDEKYHEICNAIRTGPSTIEAVDTPAAAREAI